jgi:uncharacterized protein (TIGR02246 family)
MREQTVFKLLVVLAIGGAWWRVAWAEAPANPDSDFQAIRAAAQAYIHALELGDEAALRQMWTADGDYIDATGNAWKAQDLFDEGYSASPVGAGAGSIVVQEGSLRFVSPIVAIEDGDWGLSVGDDGSVVQGRYSVVWVRHNGRWLVDSLRESTADAPPCKERLQQLEWLLGEWVGTTPDAQMITSARWSDGGSFLLREFLIRGSDGQAVGGSERISWDPHAGEIRSWTFDSQGGRGEGRWRRDGTRWVVEASEVLADGTKASTTTTYLSQDADSYFWQVASAKVGDVELPTQQVEFQRAEAK